MIDYFDYKSMAIFKAASSSTGTSRRTSRPKPPTRTRCSERSDPLQRSVESSLPKGTRRRKPADDAASPRAFASEESVFGAAPPEWGSAGGGALLHQRNRR